MISLDANESHISTQALKTFQSNFLNPSRCTTKLIKKTSDFGYLLVVKYLFDHRLFVLNWPLVSRCFVILY